MRKKHCSYCGVTYDLLELAVNSHLTIFGERFHSCPNCGALNLNPELNALPEADETHLLSCVCSSPKHKKHFQRAILPENVKFFVSTPVLTDTTVPCQILGKHMTPKGKCGLLVVLKGNLQLVWEDTGVVHDADPEHPVFLYPERYHHVQMDGPSEFRIDFYEIKYAGSFSENHEKKREEPDK